MNELPKGWSYSRLDEIATIVRGVTYSSKDVLQQVSPDAVMLLRATNIQDGVLDFLDPVWIPRSKVKSQQMLIEGDVVIASSSGSIQIVGKSASVKGRIDATFGAFCTTVRATSIEPAYLAHYLQDPSLRQKWSDLAGGSNINNLKTTDIAATFIPVPPLEEQKRIINVLDEHLSRLDRALTEIQTADLGLTNLRHASLDSLFMGDQEPFPKVTLGTLGKWVTGSTPKTSNPLYQGEDVHFVTPGDILYGGEIINVKRRISNLGADAVRRLPPPSVQVVCIGATLGKVGYSSEEVTTNQQITSLLPDEDVVTAGYAAWLLSSPLVQSLLWKYSSSTTVPILNKGTLEQIEVPLAPLEKQAEILAQIDDQTQLSVSLSERTILVRGNIDSLRRSILHRAFSGELLEGKV